MSRTEKNRQNDSLRSVEKNRYEYIIRASIDGFWFYNKDGYLLDVNEAYCKMSGYSRKELLKMNIADLDADDTEQEVRKQIREIIKNGSGRFEKRQKRKDGSIFDVEVSATFMPQDKTHFFTFIRDVTERKELDRSRRDFVSIASHQLQTPLTIIRWYIERLQDKKLGKLNDKQKEYLAEVRQSATDMTKLVSDLLNVSRVENGGLKISPEPISLKDLIEEVVRRQKKRVRTDKCKINIEVLDSLPDIPIDKSLLSQAVGNLIINAVNYSKPEDCRVMVRIKKESQKYIISVQDNGIGIPKNTQNRIFEKFFRAYNAQRRKTGGTGLGLFITKKILKAAGCDIWFESEEGRGTTFYISIPLKGMKQKKGEKQIGT